MTDDEQNAAVIAALRRRAARNHARRAALSKLFDASQRLASSDPALSRHVRDIIADIEGRIRSEKGDE